MISLLSENIEEYVAEHSLKETALLRDLAEETRLNLEYSQMLSGAVQGAFLKLLIAISGSKNVLEIGTFTGYSAIAMAEALPEDGHLLTCDLNDKYLAIAQKYIEKSPHGHKIDVRKGDALETLKKINQTFDFVFIDADKGNYPNYYELVVPLVRPGGLIVIDNVLWSGEVLNPNDEKSQAIDTLNKVITNDHRVESVLLTVRDGLNLVRKLSLT